MTPFKRVFGLVLHVRILQIKNAPEMFSNSHKGDGFKLLCLFEKGINRKKNGYNFRAIFRTFSDSHELDIFLCSGIAIILKNAQVLVLNL